MRVRGRLAINKMALEHGDDVLQATFNEIMARDKKLKDIKRGSR